MEGIDAALSQESGMIEEFDDIRTRHFISSIKVLDKERLLIRLKNGTESVRHLGKEAVRKNVIRLLSGKTPKRQQNIP